MRRLRRIAACALLGAALGATQSAPALAGDREPPPRYCPRGDRAGFDANTLVGRAVPRAAAIAREHGCSVRVVRRNGEWLVVTMDYSSSRINLIVRDRRVVRIHGIY